MKAGLLALLLIGVSTFSQATIVRVVALFPDKAMVMINGQRHFLRVGKKPVSGVRLLTASSKQALMDVDGVQKTFYLSRDMGGGIQAPQTQSARVNRNNNGQYIAQGFINNRSVNMLLDTGANVVAMNAGDASRLGIDYKNGKVVNVNTASDTVKGFRVMLSSVAVGGITISNVEATVIEGGYPDVVLLGMSYLKHIKFSEDRGVMLLQSRY